MGTDTVSAPGAERISQATWDILARGWTEGRTVFEVLTALNRKLDHARNWIEKWGASRPGVWEGKGHMSMFNAPELGVRIMVAGGYHYRHECTPQKPYWWVEDLTSQPRAGDGRRSLNLLGPRVCDLSKTLQAHDALDDLPMGAVRLQPTRTGGTVDVPQNSGMPTWAMWAKDMKFPGDGPFPLPVAPVPGTAANAVPFRGNVRASAVWLLRYIPTWARRLADEAGEALTAEEAERIDRVCAMMLRGEATLIGHPRCRETLNPTWWATMTAEDQERLRAEDIADNPRRWGVSYDDPGVRSQIARLLYAANCWTSSAPEKAQDWAREALAADIAAALGGGA